MGDHGLGPPADRQGTDPLAADVPDHLPGGRVAHEDGAGLRDRLQTSRDVDRVADRRVVALGVVAEAAHHHRAAVEPHPHLDRLEPGRREIAQQAPPQRERREDRPARVILVGGRHPDEGHEAVAHEAVDRAAVEPQLLQRQVRVPAQERVHRLGTDPLGDRGRADDVAEEHRHRLVLPLRCVRSRRPRLVGERASAAGAEALGGIGRLTTRRAPAAERRPAIRAEPRGGVGVGPAGGAGCAHVPHGSHGPNGPSTSERRHLGQVLGLRRGGHQQGGPWSRGQAVTAARSARPMRAEDLHFLG